MAPVQCTTAELAAYVQDEMSLAVGGTLFSRVPLELIDEVCRRKPSRLHYLSWGGGLPMEKLLEVDAIATATLCFSSLDIFGPAPLFRAAVETDALPIVELNAHALCQGLAAGKRRFPSEVFTWPGGCDLTALPGYPNSTTDPVTGTRIGAVAAIRPDVFLMHASAADEDGNVEIVGARTMDLVVAAASKAVLVTVEELKPRGTLGAFPGSVVLSRHFVTAFAVAPGGAAPTSCFPYYLADYQELLGMTSGDSAPNHHAHSGRAHAPLATLSVRQVEDAIADLPGEPLDDSPATVDEWMATCLARRYSSESVCSVGAVSPLATTSYLLAKRLHAPGLTLITNGGCYVDVPDRPVLLGLGEWLDCCGAVTQMGGEESFEWFYQQGRVTHEVVSAAQVDALGRTNNWKVRTPSGRLVRLPGQGGMADVANMHANFILYLPRQSKLNTPQVADFSSAARTLVSDTERMAAGYQPGEVALVTNLAIFGWDAAEGGLVVRERFPWTTLDELRESTGFDVHGFDDSTLAREPSPSELTTLREVVDPLGIRRLEFQPSKDRLPALRRVIEEERAVAHAVLDTPFWSR
jgi:glutaconate CoA-transferase, subunit A